MYWGIFSLLPDQIPSKVKYFLICISIVVFSMVVYVWDDNKIFGWPVESFGFIYGILLALNKDKVKDMLTSNWAIKSLSLCCLCFLAGILYLNIKSIVFFGDYVVRIILGFLLLFFILSLNAKFPIGNPASSFLGKISYEVYLLHDVVFIVLSALPIYFNSGLFILLSIIITIIVSSIVNIVSKNIIDSLGKIYVKKT